MTDVTMTTPQAMRVIKAVHNFIEVPRLISRRFPSNDSRLGTKQKASSASADDIPMRRSPVSVTSRIYYRCGRTPPPDARVADWIVGEVSQASALVRAPASASVGVVSAFERRRYREMEESMAKT